MTQDGAQDPRARGNATKNPVAHAFDRTTRWFGNILAPVVIITYARDVEDALNYIMERPLITSLLIIFFIIVLLYNTWGMGRIQFSIRGRKTDDSATDLAEGSADQTIEPPQDRKRGRGFGRPQLRSVLRWAAMLGSLVAVGLLTYAYVLVFVTGLYFVAVASAPDKASAIREIQSLNRYFEEKGRSDLEARAHASSGNDWYMISIGGPHTSREDAQETFREARKVMGPKMRSDAYIYTTENVSPTRVMRNWIRGLIR